MRVQSFMVPIWAYSWVSRYDLWKLVILNDANDALEYY